MNTCSVLIGRYRSGSLALDALRGNPGSVMRRDDDLWAVYTSLTAGEHLATADEIDRLRAENKRLMGTIGEYKNELTKWQNHALRKLKDTP